MRCVLHSGFIIVELVASSVVFSSKQVEIIFTLVEHSFGVVTVCLRFYEYFIYGLEDTPYTVFHCVMYPRVSFESCTALREFLIKKLYYRVLI